MSQPCRTFSTAVANTVVGGEGEVICLSGGDFGNVNIDRSITIDCGGGVGVAGSITINAPGTVVKLRNLTVNSNLGSSFPFGIQATNVSALLIENCHVFGADGGESPGPAAGIYFGPAATATLQISNSVITGNVIPNSGGIVIKPASGVQASVTISRSRVANNSSGIVADTSRGGSIQGVVSDSVISANANSGISVTGPNAALAVSNTEVTFNATGLSVSGGGKLFTYENNKVEANTTDGDFTHKIKPR
jgi:hypothetical protein